jgi:hypothetical protein
MSQIGDSLKLSSDEAQPSSRAPANDLLNLTNDLRIERAAHALLFDSFAG